MNKNNTLFFKCFPIVIFVLELLISSCNNIRYYPTYYKENRTQFSSSRYNLILRPGHSSFPDGKNYLQLKKNKTIDTICYSKPTQVFQDEYGQAQALTISTFRFFSKTQLLSTYYNRNKFTIINNLKQKQTDNKNDTLTIDKAFKNYTPVQSSNPQGNLPILKKAKSTVNKVLINLDKSRDKLIKSIPERNENISRHQLINNMKLIFTVLGTVFLLYMMALLFGNILFVIVLGLCILYLAS